MATFVRWTVALGVLVKSVLEVMVSAEVAVKLDTGVCSVTTPVNLVTLTDVTRITEHVFPNVYLGSMEATVHKTVVQLARTADAIAQRVRVPNVRMVITENDAISIAALVA